MLPDTQAPVVFTITNEIVERLKEFFRWTDRKVLLLKGPWGAGKSYFLRKYIRDYLVPNAKAGEFPQWIAYASLFGCSTIQAAEERIVSAFQPAKGWETGEDKGWIKWVLNATKDMAFSFYGVKFSPSIGSLLWWLVRREELLIVLDDLERMEGVTLAQIMGLASSLTETSSARLKVILVCNSERLHAPDQQNLATYREKVIHTELLFNPPPEEIVAQFFHNAKEREVMMQCLRVSGQANIRIVSRVNSALSQLLELFSKHDVELRGEDRECIVRTASFYYLADRPISVAYLNELAEKEYSSKLAEMVGSAAPSSDKVTPPDPMKILADRLQVVISNKLVPIIIGWIENGNVPDLDFQSAVDWKKLESSSYDLTERREAATAFLHDFRDVDPAKAISGLQSFLESSFREAGLGTVMHFENLLRGLGVSDTDWVTKNVEAVVSNFNEDQCRSYLRELGAHSASALLQARIQALGAGQNLKDVIWRMATESGWKRGDWDFLASKSADDYEAWLLKESDVHTKYMIREILDLGSAASEGPKRDAIGNLITALNRLRKRSTLHAWRLSDFPTELATEEADS